MANGLHTLKPENAGDITNIPNNKGPENTGHNSKKPCAKTKRQQTFGAGLKGPPRSFLSELRPGDWLLLCGLSFLAFSAWQWNRKAEGKRLIVEVSQEGQRSLYPLDKDLRLTLQNAEGKQVMLIEIRDDKVWVREADCPLQYCVQRGAIQNTGQWIACLPNQVFIRMLTAGSGPEEANGDPFYIDAEVF
ncbi:NusG domain II-containing protein [Candidatus Haliotispira prima]|uniref:NusG domain II-containing protein n=1 Tax=Candidatus Haliotispira prima TaxID=3034016 RepID=A0ABY8MHD0_9SPIO|nr:NusG domain II-containing protein [Candidatus Haliotispira prima]